MICSLTLLSGLKSSESVEMSGLQVTVSSLFYFCLKVQVSTSAVGEIEMVVGCLSRQPTTEVVFPVWDVVPLVAGHRVGVEPLLVEGT